MVIVAGHLVVDPSQRNDYLSGAVEAVREGRAADGCLDFAISPDPIDPARINIFERWSSQAAVDAFRGQGPDAEQAAAIVSGVAAEYDVGAERALF